MLVNKLFKEKIIINKKNLATMLVIVLAFGFMVIGCPDTSDDDPATPSTPGIDFNGTWVDVDDLEIFGEEETTTYTKQP